MEPTKFAFLKVAVAIAALNLFNPSTLLAAKSVTVTALDEKAESEITAVLVEDVKQVRNLQKPKAKNVVVSAKLLTVTNGPAVAPFSIMLVVYDCSTPQGDYCPLKTFQLPVMANTYPETVKFVGKAPGTLTLSFSVSVPVFSETSFNVTYRPESVVVKIKAGAEGQIDSKIDVETK